jgi:hypothetical protein
MLGEGLKCTTALHRENSSEERGTRSRGYLTKLHDGIANHTRIILETDAAAIAARVSRPKADTSDIVINEQTIMSACESVSSCWGSLTRSVPRGLPESSTLERVG